MRLTLLPTIETTKRPERILMAQAENIAKGGIGLFCDRLIPAGIIVRCDIALSDLALSIPTLMRVRWTDPLENKKRYRAGLQFLL
jgi:hypothetical protein